MTYLRVLSYALVAAVAISGCKFDLDSIPSREDCIESGVGNCGGNGGSGASSGSGGTGGTGGTGATSGTGATGGTGGGACGPLQLTCDNDECVSLTSRCDGNDDCGDSSDESPLICGTGTCGANRFSCVSGSCIAINAVCDGVSDCPEGFDEHPVICNRGTCGLTEFHCDSGDCIPGDFLCDGGADCPDGSDESSLVCTVTCAEDEFACDNGSCVPLSYRCDLDNDCGDLSDESSLLCGSGGCGRQEFGCGDGTCIPFDFRCDGGADCLDASDEDPTRCNGAINTCGPCPDLTGGLGLPGVGLNLETCCVNAFTCGAREVGTTFCVDAFSVGTPDPACPSGTLSGSFPLAVGGCCRDDGRCGLDGTLFGLACVPRENTPPALGGPLNPIACGGVGPEPLCLSNNDCAPNESCAGLELNTGIAHCIQADPGGNPLGEQCSPSDPVACESQLCVDGLGECSVVCEAVDDCPNAFGEPLCFYGQTEQGAAVNLCATRCWNNGDCFPIRECAVTSTTSGEIQAMCVAVQGATSTGGYFNLLKSGDPCVTDTDCASGMCLPNFETGGGSYCSALCGFGGGGDDGRCPGSLPVCQPFDYVFGQYADLWVCTGF